MYILSVCLFAEIFIITLLITTFIISTLGQCAFVLPFKLETMFFSTMLRPFVAPCQ